MRKTGLLAVIVLCVFFILGCNNLLFPKKEKKAEAPVVLGTIIAKVNSMPITLEQLNKEIDSYNQLADKQKGLEKIETKEKKIEYLNKELIKRYLLYQEALDKKLDKNPEITQALEQLKMQLIIAELLKGVLANTESTYQEIEKFYNENKASPYFRYPEERRVREILTSSEDQAKQALIELLQGKDFSSVASTYSKDSSASKGGDLGYIKIGDNPKEFDQVVFSPSLDRGKISSIFKGPEGYYIVKIEDIRGGKEKPLSVVQDEIKSYLTLMNQEKKLQELIGSLQSQAKIEIYEERIN